MWICLRIIILCWTLEFAKVSGKTVNELQIEVLSRFKIYDTYIEKIENKSAEQDEIITQLKKQLENEKATRQ